MFFLIFISPTKVSGIVAIEEAPRFVGDGSSPRVLGKAALLERTPVEGGQRCEFSLALSLYMCQQGGVAIALGRHAYRRGNQLIIERERHQLIGYGEIAHAASGLKTGMLVRCIGRMRTDSWKDRKSCEQRYATRIVVTELTVITRSADTRASEPPDTDAADAA